MILIALGSNMPGPWGSSRQTVELAVTELNQFPLRCMKVSRLIITKAYGVENQPDFVNAVVEIETALSPESLLRKLHQIERAAGRKRGRRWGPRTLDLDLLVYHNVKRSQRGPVQKPLVLPHPGISQRSFVLEPLCEIAPQWKHPSSHLTAAQMLRSLRY
jgi:2-amino-4-hydroxy-6-hydroxymethyldihydropteridine diphosphokinase